jgi:hypothetical protein
MSYALSAMRSLIEVSPTNAKSGRDMPCGFHANMPGS